MMNLLATVGLGDVIVLGVVAAIMAMLAGISKIQQRHAEEDMRLHSQHLAKERADWERRNGR